MQHTHLHLGSMAFNLYSLLSLGSSVVIDTEGATCETEPEFGCAFKRASSYDYTVRVRWLSWAVAGALVEATV